MKQDEIRSKDEARLTLNAVHNLNLAIPGNDKIMQDYTLAFLEQHEGAREEAYDDDRFDEDSRTNGKPIRLIRLAGEKIRGNITIGIGFNMQRPKGDASCSEARQEWAAILPDVPFEKVLNGEMKLNREQVELLCHYNINIRQKELRKTYGKNWDKFRPNEQMAIMSAYFNGGPKVAGKNTNFYKHMTNYANTEDDKYLKLAVKELRDKSNPPDKNGKRSEGIQKRRNAEAILLDSTEANFYAPIKEHTTPQMITVIPGKTVVPLGLIQNWERAKDSPYYIWRCVLDGRTRPKHLAREGKVYHRDILPPPVKGHHGCRCSAEEVTVNLMITDLSKLNLIKLEYGPIYPILEVQAI